MRTAFRVLTLALICVLLIAALSPAASAVTFECKVETYSDSIYMVNLDTDMEVYAKDPDTQRYPAGLTKIMTYIIAAEYFDDFDTRIKIKQSVIDDLIATGGSAEAACKLVEDLGGKVVKVLFLMELAGLHGRDKLRNYDVSSVIVYEGK